MSHVHWWLVGLCFVMGFVLTFALILRPARGASVSAASADAAAAGGTEPAIETPSPIEWPTTPIADAVEVLATPVPAVGESALRSGPVDEESLPAELAVPEEPPWTERPAAQAPPMNDAPPATAAPAKTPPAKFWLPRKAPPAKTAPSKKAPPAKVPRKKVAPAKVPPAKRRPKLPYAPYGPGSARATPEGGGPSGWLVKGRSDTRLYYTPDDAAYLLTVAQVWFKDEAAAMRACFTPWSKSSRRK